MAERLPAVPEEGKPGAELVTPQDARLLRPVATAGELVTAKAETGKLIAEALVEGTDFGRIPGTDKPTLFKAGAETIAGAFGTRPRFELIEREVDHDRVVEWTKRKKRGGRWIEESGTSAGLYRFVVRCRLVNRATGEAVGEGLGSCSSMESRYVDRPRDVENTVLKMASKRALVQAVLITFGLSDRFSEAKPSINALRGAYHALVNELVGDVSQAERTELRHGFQRAHPDLPDSSAGWEVEDFLLAIKCLEKSGRRIFERVRELDAAASGGGAAATARDVEPELDADTTTPEWPEDDPLEGEDLGEFTAEELEGDGLPF